MRPVVLGCFLLVSLTAARAQIPLLPPAPIIVASCAGPAELWSHFLPTEVGAILTAKESATMESLLHAPVEAMADLLGTDARADLERLLDALRAVRGRLTLAIEVDAAGGDLALWLAIEDPDGADSAAIEAALLELRRGLAVPLCDSHRVDDGIARRFAWGSSGLDVSLPLRAGPRHRVVVLARDVDAALRLGLGAMGDERRAYTPTSASVAAPITVEVDLQQAVAMMMATTPRARDSLRALGFESLQRLRWTAGARGPRVELGAEIEFGPGPRGMFGGLFAVPGMLAAAATKRPAPAMHDCVPDGVGTWHAFAWSPETCVRAFLDALEADGEDGRVSARNFFGADIEERLLPALGDQAALLLRDASALFDGTVAIVLAIDDVEAFDADWPKVCAALRIDEPIEHDFGDDADPKLTLLGSDLFVSTAHVRLGSRLVLAMGRDPVGLVHSIVDRVRGGAAPSTVTRGLEQRRHAPAGWHGLGSVELEIAESALGVLALLPDGNVTHALKLLPLDEVAPMLRRAGCTNAQVFTGYAENRWRLRALF